MHNTAIVNRVEKGKTYLMHIKDYGKKEVTERSFWNIKTREFEAENSSNLILHKGDAVEFFIPEAKTILASFTILILPLILFFLSFVLLEIIGLQSEKIKALISISVLIGSFYITKILKKTGLKETLPAIVKIVSSEQLSNLKSSCSDCGSCTACD